MMPTASNDRMPRVSIIIPVFNGARWLGDAIDSALAQSYLDMEVIVVDDGSNDNGRTRAIAQSYGGQIRLVTKSNGGVASALNAGIASMRGEFFSWLSHDDLYHPRKIETQLAVALQFAEPVVVFGDVTIIDEAGRRIDDVAFTDQRHAREHAMWHVLEGRLSGCSVLIPRACFDACGTFDERLPTTQDYELWFRLAQTFRFVPAPGYLTLSRAHAEQGSRDPRHLVEVSLAWMSYINELPDDVRLGMARNEFALALRLAQLPAMSVYPGLDRFASRIRAKACAAAKVTLVIDPDRCTNPGVPQTLLADAGFTSIKAVVLAHHSQRPAVRAVSQIAIGRDAKVADIAAALVERADPGGVVLVWDDERFSNSGKLASLLERIFSEEIEGSFAADAVEDPLTGICVRTSALREAARRSLGGKPQALLHELAFLGCVPHIDDDPVSEVIVDAAWCEPLGAAPLSIASLPDLVDAISAPLPAQEIAQGLVSAPAGVGPVQPPASPAVVRLPYLGRFEILRMLRRPLLDPQRLEGALGRTERLRHLPGGILYQARLWYLEKLLGVGGKIDRVWYWRTYPDIGREVDPVLHYLRHGWREGRDPSPHFSTSAYVAKAQTPVMINPLSHATFYGGDDSADLQLGSFWSTRLLRRPLTSARATEKILGVVTRLSRKLGSRLSKPIIRAVEWWFGVSGKIDREWYAQTQMGPHEAGLDPSLHYLAIGWRQGLAASRQQATVQRAGDQGFPSPDKLSHLNPLSRQAFLGGENPVAVVLPEPDSMIEETLTVSAPEQPVALPEPVAPLAHTVPLVETCSAPLAAASTGFSKSLAAELLFVADGSTVADEWIGLVQRSVDPQINTITLRARGDTLVISDGPDDYVYNAQGDLHSARVYLLERGIRRADCVGVPRSEKILALLHLLNVPMDVTMVSAIDGPPESDLLEGADRILVADPEIMRGLKDFIDADRMKLVPMPKERERFGFKVSKRSASRGEAFRILALSALPSEDSASQLKAVAKLVDARRLSIEIHAMQDCTGVSSEQSLHWLGDRPGEQRVAALGEVDPHLIWVLTDPNEALAPFLLDIAGLGLPIFLSGSAMAARRLHGRPYSWATTDLSAATIAEQLESLRQNGMDLPATGISPSGMSTISAFYPETYLNWRFDEK